MIDRRSFALATAAALASGPAAWAGRGPVGDRLKSKVSPEVQCVPGGGRIPIVIAHRGASGERPEHTAMAYRLAVEQGADFIEPDLVLTRDGHFVCRHENEIGGTTDVAARPEFAARRTSKVIDGEQIAGWFTEDFTLAELKTLRCRERLPGVRPANTAFDGREAIPTFDEVVALAAAEGRRTGRTIGLYPELKHPRHFAGAGLAMERRFADRLKANGFDRRTAPVFVQCFEVTPLKTLRELVKTPLVQLISDAGGPADLAGATYAEMTSASGLKAIAAYADGVGPHSRHVVPTDGKALLPATGFVRDAHAAGLKVHPWTVRRENAFLPTGLRSSETPSEVGDVGALFSALLRAGVDGVFTDNVAEGVKARNAFIGGKA